MGIQRYIMLGALAVTFTAGGIHDDLPGVVDAFTGHSEHPPYEYCPLCAGTPAPVTQLTDGGVDGMALAELHSPEERTELSPDEIACEEVAE